MPFHSRKPTRMPGYDYSSQNYYFITICTHEKKCIFGKPGELNTLGGMAQDCMEKIASLHTGIRIDNFIIMPNHVHAIVILGNKTNVSSISTLIGQYKTAVTKQIRKIYPEAVIWQRSFHDHIIRNQSSYEKIWNYVEYNAQKWESDCFYQK